MDEDAVPGDQHLVNRERQLRVRVRHNLDRPCIRAHQGDLFPDQPFRGADPDAGRTAVESRVVFLPERPPAGVHEHRVARTDVRLAHVLRLERRLQVGGRDLLALVHPAAPEALDIHQHASGEERVELLDAQLVDAVSVGHLLRGEAVVETLFALIARLAGLDADMREAVELGPDLTDLGAQKLVVPNDLVVAEGPAGRRARNAHRKSTVAE